MRVPLFVQEIGRGIAARRALSGFLSDLGKSPARTFEGLGSLRLRYQFALAPDAPVCGSYTNEPDDGFDACDNCGRTKADHA